MAVDPAATVHPTAILDAGATIGPGCRIGPYCVIGPDVVLGAGVVLHSHVVIAGITRIGEGTQVFPFAALGTAPQDLKYHGERTELVIGARNRIREYATLSPGTEGGGGVTRIGDDNLLMMGTHVGHDCQLGNRIILANNVILGGHCVIGDMAVLGGHAAVHQFTRIGQGAMIGGMTGVVADVIPYGTVMGERAHLAGLNLTGLKRRGTDRALIHGLRAAFAALFDADEAAPLQARASAVAASHGDNPLVRDVLDFLAADTSRSFTMPPG